MTLATSPLFLAAAAFGTLGVILILAGIAALARRRPLRFALRTLAGLLLVCLGALAREDVAARILVRPAGPQRFAAAVRFPDGREVNFDLAGDEIYIDARILK